MFSEWTQELKDKIYIVLIQCFIGLSVFGQGADETNKRPGDLLLKMSYGVDFSIGDLSDRFGTYFSPGVQLDYILTTGLTFGLSYQFHFGSTVKEDVLSNLRDEQAIIIGTNNTIADVFLRQRGFALMSLIGYFQPLGGDNGSLNVHAQGGVGIWQHKIRIVDDQNSVPQVRDEFVPGYDRLSNGLAFSQNLGITYLSTKNATRFFIQAELREGFIKNRRDWDIPLKRKLDDSRFDVSMGFRLGWIVPILGGDRRTGDIFY